MSNEMRDRPALVAIPLYRNANLVAPLVSSLARTGADLRKIRASILFVVDSPDDEELLEALSKSLPSLAEFCTAEIHINEENLGFIGSMNFALDRALRDNCDVIILNSDVEVFENAFPEMQRVAYADPMIGFVSPRSNNATIATFPHDAGSTEMDAGEAYELYSSLGHRLQDFVYTPTAIGFAMYIKWSILKEFGTFDAVYGRGYNEENDLVLRANRCGYRAALANKAFVYHAGEKSFDLLAKKRDIREQENALILNERYPEYRRALEEYAESDYFLSEALLSSLAHAKNRMAKIGFDLTRVASFYNGTFEAACRLVEAIVAVGHEKFEFFVVCSGSAFTFHNLHKVKGLSRLDKDDNLPLSAIIRIGQPFEPGEAVWARRRAPVLAVVMLDTIALDCAYLRTNWLHRLWQTMIDAADIIVFNSVFTARQFESRFRFPSNTQFLTLLHSTDASEYRTKDARPSQGAKSGEGYILVVGNRMAHKFVAATSEIIRRSGAGRNFVMFGQEGESPDPNIEYIPASELSPETVDALYANASSIVFPSHYEGFGFPILNAVAWSKPVFARDLPAYREIAAASPDSKNIHLFETTEEIVAAAISGKYPWQPPDTNSVKPYPWAESGKEILAAVIGKLEAVTQAHLLEKVGAIDRGQPNLVRAIAEREALMIAVLRAARQRAAADRGLRIAALWRRKNLKLLASSPLFDRDWYKKEYKDVAEGGACPIKHYLEFGWREGRNPGPFFDTGYYLREHIDVRQQGMNPLVHYLQAGIFEGRAVRNLVGDRVVLKGDI